MTNKSFIESEFPIKEVSEESAREKNIRHGHISTLHIWWARRPLASSRASIYAALTPEPKDEEERLKKAQSIANLSKWENSLNKNLIERAREEILKANGGKPPKVLDPFAGGGAIPLEALRLGCETYASDLNPVAVLILKCTLEYPQKYSQRANSQWAIANRQGGKSENRVVSGTASLAESHKTGDRDLQDDTNFPEGRDLRSDKPGSESSNLSSSEHSRRMGPEYDKGVYSVSEDSEGFFVRSRDSSDNIEEFELHKQPNFGDDVTKDSRDKQDAQCSDKQLEQGQMSLLANDGYSLLADVKKWGNWVLEEAKRKLADFIHLTLMVLFPSAISGQEQ